MVVEDLDAAEIRGWAVGLSALHQRIAKHVGRAEPRHLAYDYLRALLSPIERSASRRGCGAPSSFCCRCMCSGASSGQVADRA